MLQRVGSRALQRTATEHSRGANCSPPSSSSEADFAQRRSATEHSPARSAWNPKQRTATEHSPARSCVLDPDIRLQKSRTPTAVRIKGHHGRTPDVGIGILIFMPSYRAGEESPEMIEYYGEYLNHGQSKTVFDLNCPGARFHGKVLKVAKATDMEPSVFMKAAQVGLTTSILYNCDGVDADSGRRFHCWITDRTIPLDEFCRDDDAIKSRCSLAAFCCIVRAAKHGLYLSDNWFFNFGVDVSDNAKDHPVLIIDAGGWGINQEEPWTKGEIKKKVIYKFWKACAKESIDCSELRDMWKNAWTINDICEMATEAWNTRPFLTNIAESSSALRPASESPLHLRGVLCTLLGPPTWQPTGSPSMSNWQPTHQTATD